MNLLSFVCKKKSENSIVPLYGCSDNCCDYVFIKIKTNNKQVIWGNLGRNSEYIFPKKETNNGIEWIKNFNPISFSKNNYNSIIIN